MSTGAGVSWHARFDYDTNVNKAVELPAGVVYRLFSAQHARVSPNIILGMISVVRTLHSLVIHVHNCKASVLDICIVLVY